MIPTPDIPAENKDGLSYYYLSTRMPIILTRLIDHLARRQNELDIVENCLDIDQKEDVITALRVFVSELPRLKNEMITNKPFSDIIPENYEWKAVFEDQRSKVSSESFKWFFVPFLFSEEYFYNRIYLNVSYSQNASFSNFDPFKLFKQEAFEEYLQDACILAKQLISFKKCLPTNLNVKQQMNKIALISICAENCDSKFFRSQSQVSFANLNSSRFKLFVDKFDNLYEHIKQLQGPSHQHIKIAFFLNYSGFDLFATFCLAESIHTMISQNGSNCSITFYTEKQTMFLHATEEDIKWFLSYKSHDENVLNVLQMVSKRFSSHEWSIVSSLNKNSQQKYDLCFFKGDLNYRKLISGLCWDHKTSLKEAINKDFSKFGKSICTMRAIKSDLIVDLSKYSMNEMKNNFIHDTVNCLDLNFTVIE